jgi:DNA polymerase-3 subunit alpha
MKTTLTPKINIPCGMQSANEYLGQIVFEKAKAHYEEKLNSETEERIKEELTEICKYNKAGYFLFTAQILETIREKLKIDMYATHEAICSIVAYLLGITDVDPMKFGLSFADMHKSDKNNIRSLSLGIYHQNDEAALELLNQTFPSCIFFHPYDRKRYTVEKRNENNTKPSPVRLFEFVDKKITLNLVMMVADRAEYGDGHFIPERSQIDADSTAKRRLRSIPCEFSRQSLLESGAYMYYITNNHHTLIYNTLRCINEKRGCTIDIENIPINDDKVFELYRNNDIAGITSYDNFNLKRHGQLCPHSFEDIVDYFISIQALSKPGRINMATATYLALTSYRTAYLKTYYREEFLNNVQLLSKHEMPQ